MTVQVGSPGGTPSDTGSYSNGGAGGTPGGGAGGGTELPAGVGGGGGGYSGLLVGSSSGPLVIAAGGGGGGGGAGGNGDTGSGGGVGGGSGGGGGATSTSGCMNSGGTGGQGNDGDGNGSPGSFLQGGGGGSAGDTDSSGGGGGGGYCGGGGGAGGGVEGAAGGGGSSYGISGLTDEATSSAAASVSISYRVTATTSSTTTTTSSTTTTRSSTTTTRSSTTSSTTSSTSTSTAVAPVAPVAVATVSPGRAGLSYQLSGARSQAPAGHQITSYRWTLAGKTIGSAETLTHTFAQPGVAYPVGLTVTDDQAQSATTTVTVTPHTKPATVRQTVRFGLDRADLTRAARTALAPLRGLVAYATSTQITGYCAAHETSTRSTLLELSRQRAQAVASYLFAGHDRSGVSISGEGATNFVATNQTASGCAKNRRVQIQVRYPKPTL